MTNSDRSPPRGLDAIAEAAKVAEAGGARTLDPRDEQRAAPVDSWSPEDCGDLDIRISRDGLWWYLGTPIGREPLVRLFASVLTLEADGKHYLVTPVEKIGIAVDDVAFVAVDFEIVDDPEGPLIRLVTNVGDKIALGPTRRLRVEIDAETGEPTPYAPVRGRLEARIDRKTFYRLVDRSEFIDLPAGGAEAGGVAPERAFGFWSAGVFFPLATGAAAEALERAARG